MQYLENYKDILKKFSKAKSKYIIISQTPFFNSQLIDKNIVVKQLNIHPQINYAYFFKYLLETIGWKAFEHFDALF